MGGLMRRVLMVTHRLVCKRPKNELTLSFVVVQTISFETPTSYAICIILYHSVLLIYCHCIVIVLFHCIVKTCKQLCFGGRNIIAICLLCLPHRWRLQHHPGFGSESLADLSFFDSMQWLNWQKAIQFWNMHVTHWPWPLTQNRLKRSENASVVTRWWWSITIDSRIPATSSEKADKSFNHFHLTQ